MNPLKATEKINLREILQDLEHYRPRRRGWTWRVCPADGRLRMGPFEYQDASAPLKQSIPMPAARYFQGIDPQPRPVITSEIASGRFEDDIRRMRMAAWHGADHMMVIRTMGQSHIDGLIEGTPEGVGGVPISRKQIRATRKALDLIEDEVGRPINLHSYVSGIAGPEIAVLFAEEGVNGAHQDPQYNVLYRGINMVRSFVDAAVAKRLLAWAGIFQIDGAHNANATAREAWRVMPELMVQHAINCVYSRKAGLPPDLIGLSTVPPTSAPMPKLAYDLPYAVALRDIFSEYKMRAQMNTRYIESDTEEATRTHVIDVLISALTRADIQSTITPDEGRNVPWHYNSIRGIHTAKQTLTALDGIKDLVAIRADGRVAVQVRELKERAVLFLEEILETGGYFEAVARGFFVDSGRYPERHGDGIARPVAGGIGADTVAPRDADYFAPVCAHFGDNHVPPGAQRPCEAIGGCTLCNPGKIVYMDELDPDDHVELRLEPKDEDQRQHRLKPEVEWHGDGTVVVSLFLPAAAEIAEAAALEMVRRMGLQNPAVIHRQVLHPAEGVYLEVKGKVDFAVDLDRLVIPKKEALLAEETIRAAVQQHGLTVVAATVGQDEHSVGLREILDIKHGGIEKYGVRCHYLGTSVPLEKVVDAARETGADAILISTIISHNNVHYANMQKLHDLCVEKGLRPRVLLVAGGTQVDPAEARRHGMDAGFGRGTKGHVVASFLVSRKLAKAK